MIVTERETYRQIKDLMKKYYQLGEYSSNTVGSSVRGNIETRLDQLSLNGLEILELFGDLEIIAEKDREEERDEQVEQAVYIYNNKGFYGLK